MLLEVEAEMVIFVPRDPPCWHHLLSRASIKPMATKLDNAHRILWVSRKGMVRHMSTASNIKDAPDSLVDRPRHSRQVF